MVRVQNRIVGGATASGSLPAVASKWTRPKTQRHLSQQRRRWIGEFLRAVHPNVQAIDPLKVFAGALERSRKHIVDVCNGRHNLSDDILNQLRSALFRCSSALPIAVMTRAWVPGRPKRSEEFRQTVQEDGVQITLPRGSVLHLDPNGAVRRIAMPEGQDVRIDSITAPKKRASRPGGRRSN